MRVVDRLVAAGADINAPGNREHNRCSPWPTGMAPCRRRCAGTALGYSERLMSAAPRFSHKPLVVAVLATVAVYRASSRAARRPSRPPPTPKLAAPVDLTGYWVSLVTEDWRYRMTTPPKGDYTGCQSTPAGRQVADAWDPARDEAAGDQCKAYGVGGVMRLPTRLHISWQDDQTLKLETDAGTQTRMIAIRRRLDDRAATGRARLRRAGIDRAASMGGGLRRARRRRPWRSAQSRHDPDEARLPAQERRSLQRGRRRDRVLRSLRRPGRRLAAGRLDRNRRSGVSRDSRSGRARISNDRPTPTGWNPTPCAAR